MKLFCGCWKTTLTKLVLEYKEGYRVEVDQQAYLNIMQLIPTTDFTGVLRNKFLLVKTMKSAHQMKGLKLLLSFILSMFKVVILWQQNDGFGVLFCFNKKKKNHEQAFSCLDIL